MEPTPRNTPGSCSQCKELSRCESHKLPIETIHAVMTTMDDTLNPKIIAGIYNLEPMQSQLLVKQLMEYHETCADRRWRQAAS